MYPTDIVPWCDERAARYWVMRRRARRLRLAYAMGFVLGRTAGVAKVMCVLARSTQDAVRAVNDMAASMNTLERALLSQRAWRLRWLGWLLPAGAVEWLAVRWPDWALPGGDDDSD